MMKPDIQGILSTIKYGDIIEVKWLDACRASPVKEHQLSNKVFATYKKRIGKFWAIRYDKLYHEAFLILYVDEETQTIESIPVKVIVGITKLRRGGRLKLVSNAGDIYLGGGQVKCKVIAGGIGEVVWEEEENL